MLEQDKNYEENLNNNSDISSEGLELKDYTIFWSITAVVIALAIFVFLLFQFFERNLVTVDDGEIPETPTALIPEDDYQSNFQGKIYLTLSPKGEKTVGIYSYDLKTEKLEEAKVDDGLLIMGGEISIDKKYMLSANGEQIHMHNMDNLDEWWRLTDDETRNKKDPVWSKDEKTVLYIAQEDTSLDISVPNNWGIYYVDEEKEETFLANGVHPRFSADGKYIIYLKNDGLYAMGIEEEGISKIWGVDSVDANYDMQLDISKKDNIGAWTNPNNGKLYLLETKTNENLFEGNILKEINTYAFWPTFSPDDKYLAVKEVQVENGLYINPKLVIYDMKTYDRHEILDLNNYDLNKTWINDWR